MTASLVLVTELPSGETPATLAPAPDTSLRVLQVMARPDMRKVASLAGDVMRALGKDPTAHGGSYKDRSGTTRVPLWFLAHRTEWIVLLGAQEVPALVLHGGLLDSALYGGARVLLVTDAGQRAAAMHTAAGYGAEYVDYRTWAAEQRLVLGPIKAGPPATPPEASVWDTLELPRADWPWFRARCRDQLTQAAFRAFDALYLRALHTIRNDAPDYAAKTIDSIRLDVRPIVKLIGDVLGRDFTRAQALVVLRAAQAALFSRGFLLRADIDTLLNLLDDGAISSDLSDFQWKALRAYQQPWRSAACTLAASGHGIAQTLSFTVAQAHDACVTTDSRIDPRGRDYVLAQVHERTAEGAQPHDPLFKALPGMVARALRDSRGDLGRRLGGYVPIRQERSPEQNWQDMAARSFLLLDVR